MHLPVDFEAEDKEQVGVVAQAAVAEVRPGQAARAAMEAPENPLAPTSRVISQVRLLTLIAGEEEKIREEAEAAGEEVDMEAVEVAPNPISPGARTRDEAASQAVVKLVAKAPEITRRRSSRRGNQILAPS